MYTAQIGCKLICLFANSPAQQTCSASASAFSAPGGGGSCSAALDSAARHSGHAGLLRSITSSMHARQKACRQGVMHGAAIGSFRHTARPGRRVAPGRRCMRRVGLTVHVARRTARADATNVTNFVRHCQRGLSCDMAA